MKRKAKKRTPLYMLAYAAAWRWCKRNGIPPAKNIDVRVAFMEGARWARRKKR